MSITDLTNTTWVVPAGWSAKHNYGTFSVDYDYEYGTNSGSQTTLRIGYDTGAGDDGTNCIGFSTYPAIFSNTAFTITFTGGTDVTNASLISWLETYGELQGGDAPTNVVTITYKDTTIPVEAGQAVTLSTADKKLTGDIAITAPKESGGDARDFRILGGLLYADGGSVIKQVFYRLYSETNGDKGNDKLHNGENNTFDGRDVMYKQGVWAKIPAGDKVAINFWTSYDATPVTVTANGKNIPITLTASDSSASWFYKAYHSDYFEVSEDVLDLVIYTNKPFVEN